MKKAMKRAWKAKVQVLVWLLVISLIVPMLPPPKASAAAELPMRLTDVTATTKFQDVKNTDWFHDAVVQMQAKGIFSGTTADTFSPKGTMTRAMYITALGRMAGVDTGAYLTSSFADVPVGSWYAPYIEWAVQKRITDGTGAGKYSPNATVSREQMATMTLRYFESEQIPYQTGTPLTTQPGDLANVSPWAADAVVKLWQAGVFTGDEKGNFNPRNQATRAEAAVLFMRNSTIVEVWKGSNPSKPEPTPTTKPTPTVTPTPTPSAGGNNGGGTPGGNNGGQAPGDNGGGTPAPGVTYTLTFESNGGSAIAAQTVRSDQALTDLPAPTKEGYIFQGWFSDSDLTQIFASGTALGGNTTLYAKYTDSVDSALQSVPSYSVLDVAPDYSIQVEDATGSLTQAEVKSAMAFVDISNPESEGVAVEGSSGLFTIRSAAEDGKFVEGHTYQLTLKDGNLSFRGQDATTDIYVFSVAKQEVMNIPLNADMIYLPFADVADMMLNGEVMDSPSIPVIATTVDGSGSTLAEANSGSGTFSYHKEEVIQIGDTVAIYQGLRPDLRTLETTGEDNGDIAYVQITAVSGNTYTYDHAEADQVLFKPDILPVSADAGVDKDGDPNNHSITVEHTVLDYSDIRYEPLGLDELTTVDEGDFIGFYTGGFAEEDFESVGYGRITSVTSEAEMTTITYTEATVEEVTSAFDLYQKQAIDGEELLSEEQIEQLEEQIEQQAKESGFVDQAADYLSDMAMETPEFKEVKAQTFLASSGKDSRVSVKNRNVTASLGTKLKNIKGRSSGVSATLQVSADIVVENGDESSLIIHMTGTFVQEISLNLNVNSETSWHWYTISTWLGDIPIFPIIDDYVVTANLDAHSYTGMNITAEIGFAEPDELEDVLEDWLDAKTSGKLSEVRNIAEQLKSAMDGPEDTDDLDANSLREQYKEMLEQDTEWVPLIKQELFEKSVRVALGIVEVNFSAEFVLSAQVNLTIGADFYYQMAKRYSVTLRVLSFSGSSNTVSLPGDGDYQFTFYVMGTIGLRAGIHMEVKAGVGSVDLNSIGLAVEPGVYVNLWGYFYYQLKNISGMKSTQSMGALFVEIGIYLVVELGAQLGDGALSDGVDLIDEEWPLYTIGRPDNVYDFAYEQDDSLEFTMAGSVSSIAVPKSWLTMSTLDLKTGDTEERAYKPSDFDIQVDHPNFKYNQADGKMTVVDTTRPVSKGNVVITWKGAPLSFTAHPIKRTIPLTWRTTEGEYIIQLHPENGGVTQVLPFVYDAGVKVSDPTYAGYTFDGWYTEAAGGEKVTIPSRMPKDDYELYAHWTANTDTPYTVEHYLVDPNSRVSNPPVFTEMLQGTTDTEIRISSDRYEDQGYRTGIVNETLIKGDGSTVVRVNYYPANRKLTFNWNYAGAPESSVTEAIGRNIAARIPVPTRPGYTFAGWSPEVPTAMPSSDTTYTAQWKEREDTPYQVAHLLQNIGSDTYTVADTESYRGMTDAEVNAENLTPRSYAGFKFDETIPGTVLNSRIASNGKTVLKLYYKRDANTLTINYNGSGQENKVIEVPVGATTQIYLGTPIWQGHVFDGWSPTPPKIMPEEDIAVTANWTTNMHTVNFDSNGGDVEVESQNVAYGSQASVPNEPTKEGYVFGGWYSESDPAAVYDFAMPVTGDLILRAQWLLRYTVNFESNEGSAVDAQMVNEGQKAVAPIAPERADYVFSGWYSDIDLTTPYDFTTSVVTMDITLYAKWVVYVPNTYTVTFESNGGTVVDPRIVNEGAVAAAPGTPIREGYVFGGWYSDSNFQSSYGFTAGVTQDITLYANWTRKSYTVSFNSNQGSIVSSQSVNEGGMASQPSAPTRDGYRFAGWYSDIGLQTAYGFTESVTQNIVLYANWTAIYTVSFNSDGGSAVESQTVEYDRTVTKPTAPAKEGYTFIGWYSDAELNEVYNFATSVTSHLTLYAKWKLNTFTVSFESNGGPSIESQIVTPGSKAVVPPEPKWEGYRFDGWYSDSDRTKAFVFATSVTADLTLYAKWTMTAWQQLGDEFMASHAYQSDVVLDSNGIPHVAVMTPDQEVFVMKYEENRWQTIGSPTDFDSNFVAKNTAQVFSTLSLAIDSKDTPYLVYGGYFEGSSKLIVTRYVDGEWEEVGDMNELAKPFYLFFNSLAFDENDTPYLSSMVMGYSPNDYLQVFTYTNGNWEEIDLIKDKRFSRVTEIGVAANGNLNVAYNFYDSVSQTSKVVMRTYEHAGEGSVWNAANESEIAVDTADMPSLAMDPSGVPYLVYQKSKVVNVAKYTGSVWEAVGTTEVSAKNIVNSETSVKYIVSIDFDSEGTPYVAYRDNVDGGRVKVLKYENMNWIPVEYEGIATKATTNVKLAIDNLGSIYVGYVVGQVLKVMKHDPKLYQP